MLARHGWLLSICLAGALASLAAEKTPRRDAHGDPLPAGARARLGTTRFRVGDAGACLAISPDGATLATGGGSSVRFWDRTTGAERRSVQLPVLSIFHVAISPDGKYFAALGDNQSVISRPLGGPSDFSVFVGEVGGGKVRQPFRGEYASAAFSADGKWLLAHESSKAGESERPVLVWDIASGKEVRRFPGVLSYALSPDGKMLAGGDTKGVIRLWSLKSGAERGQLKGHGSPVQALAFSPNSQTLVSASGDRRGVGIGGDKEPERRDHGIRMWDIASGKECWRIRREHANTRWLRFAPDGKTFASADDSYAFTLWDAKTGRRRQRFPDKRSGEYTTCFSPDGKYLFYEGASIGQEVGGTIHQWDIAAGKEIRRWKTPERWPGAFLFAPDGKTLFGLGDSIHVWDATTGEERNGGPDHRAAIRTLTFSRDGKRLATLDEDACLRVWDAVRGVPLPALAAERVTRCTFAPDGDSLITITSDATVQVSAVPSGRLLRRFRVGGSATVRRWQWLTNSREGDLNLSGHPRDCCVLDPSCRVLAVVHEDQDIHLWDVRRGEELRRLEGHRGGVGGLVFSPDGKWLFSGGADGTVRWWDAGKGVEIQRFQEDGTDSAIFSLDADGRMLAWAGGERIHLHDLAARRETRQWKGHAKGTNRVLFGRGGTVLASVGYDGAFRYWDIRKDSELRAIRVEKNLYDIKLFAAPGGRLFAYLSMDGVNSEYALRDVATGGEVCRTRTYSFEQFALAPDGNTAVMNRSWWGHAEKTSEDKKLPTPARAADDLMFLELASGAVVADVSAGHRGRVRCLVFSPDGQTLATGGEDASVLLWDWRRLTGLTHEDTAASADKEIEATWMALASPDGRKGYRAIGALAACGDKAVSLLRERLRPAADADRQRWRKWIAELDDSSFTVREQATQALTRLGVESELFLRRATAEKVSLEMRRRLELILASAAMKRPSGDSLRKIRATQVLEAIGTPAARELLEAWSRGDADAWLTQEARSALRRTRP